ncbi:MAG: putative SWI/SNF-related matrix-associated actin-dependent regulator of chromatin subfamily B member 1 [Olpidium bornovanus]|uniref:SWI/SNF-related matrix-associated actin-dependent regulator of chromatin subfamily B member 1 n=1 Tax=Olpidium bornovanus TaxID=278681 RepID=A0A8H8DH80_9FUNG|nr:MAG: putative SWI/SNF-related matrix-associated actin-dependent regulator of chromatin subfamily B member 1 [Olpidium bornovanus]
MEALAGVQEALCPIRLDIDTEDMKLRDTFMWNVNEQHLTPEQFAEILCDDLDIPPDQFVAPIAESIKGQVDEYEALQSIYLGEDEDLEYRTTIELDLHLGSVHYCDRFEWDLASSWPTPEGFARQLCADLGVGGEFVNCIAHALHEQLYRHRKEKILRLEETDEQEEEHPPLESVFRPPIEAERWSPLMELLSPDALEKALLEKERGLR